MNYETKVTTSSNSAAHTGNDARLNLLYEIGRILASAKTMEEAAPQILEAICRRTGFELGELWWMRSETLRIEKVWHLPTARLENFVENSRSYRYVKGEGLPGTIWEKHLPLWIERLDDAVELPRRALMRSAGLQSAFAFPVLLGEKLLGTFSFFSSESLAPDEALLQMFVAVGSHIGQFCKRESIENSLRESEESYRIVAETATDAIIKIDEQSKILFVNHSVERIFGYPVEAMLGQSLTMIMPENMRLRHKAGFRRYLEFGKRHLTWESIEVPALHQSGRIFPLEMSFGEYNENGKRFFIAIARDISGRKQVEETLLERERLALLNSEVSRALIQNDSLQEILHRCTEAVVKHLDAAFARIWTLKTDENVLELQTSSGIYTHLDGAHSRIPVGQFKIGLIAEERKPILTNSVIGDVRVSNQEWARREGMIAFAGYPLIVEKHLVGVVAMFARQPFTEQTIEALASISNTIALGIKRKETEAEREILLENEKTLRLEAEVANRVKDEFIAVVSHELRAPLNAMLGWTRILQNNLPDAATTEHALNVITRNARAQSKLIEDLLDSSRISRGELRLEMQPLELVPIIKAAVEVAAPAAEAKNISVSIFSETAADRVTGDGDRLSQILDNLLSNAIKFTPVGGSVEIRLEREENEAKIVITDSGQGISADFLPQVFQRFRQADPADTRRHGGLGIGLSLARHLVELHGGMISAHSAGEGKGATFIVKLPLRTVAPINLDSTYDETRSMNNQGKLSGVWVLAVDDEADAREMVSFMLQINGAKVTSAKSAVEALEILREAGDKLPDLLLSDISMPNESGYALLEKVRALPLENGGQIPAIALTAFNRPEDRQAALEAGFQRHLGKPIEPDNLISAIIEMAGMK